jgi:hypothetical protein
MEWFRRQLGRIGLVWLVCQSTALAMSPYAICCMPATQAAVDDDACCKGMAPGEMCPLHKHGQQQKDNRDHDQSSDDASNSCAVRDACPPVQQALILVGFAPGILPEPVSVHVNLVSIRVPAQRVISVSQSRSLDPPPPRA